MNPIVKARLGGVVLRPGTGEADMRSPCPTGRSVQLVSELHVTVSSGKVTFSERSYLQKSKIR